MERVIDRRSVVCYIDTKLFYQEENIMECLTGAAVDIRSRIKDAARELFRAKGFDNTTVADLLNRLQIEEHQFLAVFQSMDDLLEAVWSES